MAQIVINALLSPTINTATSKVSRPSTAPVKLDVLCGAEAQDAWLDLSFATEEAEERGLIGRSQYDTDGNSPSTSSNSHRPKHFFSPTNYLGLVTKTIPANSSDFHSPKGRKAIFDEVDDLRGEEVWDEGSVAE